MPHALQLCSGSLQGVFLHFLSCFAQLRLILSISLESLSES